MNPENLRYTVEHEWVREDAPGVVRIGITDYAQEALGDVVYVSLPVVGSVLAAGDPCGELESTKSVSDVYAPVAGTVTAINDALDGSPDLVNTDAYGEGWLFELQVADPADLNGLLDAAAYEAHTGS